MSSAVRMLVLVRHGQSTDNERNLFSGFRNPSLTERGVAEAKAAGRKLKALGYHFDVAFTSKLDRAQRTLALMLEQLTQVDLPIQVDAALNERDYGELSGLNKQKRAASGARNGFTFGANPTMPCLRGVKALL